jgi:protein-S-isoprenylcysteine O-methyltransferase Ste14
MKRYLALAYGIACYVFFLGTFLYTIGFVGNVGVPKSIDSGTPSVLFKATVIDMLLLGVFAIQHSVMARQGFKQHWTRLVSWYLERSTYVLAATAALALLLWQWRPIPRVIWDLHGTPAAIALQILFWMGWGVIFLSASLIDHSELVGLQQILDGMRSHFSERVSH